MTAARAGLRITGIFILQFVVIFILTRLIGTPIMSATIWRVPLGSCYGYDVDFRFLIGLSAASIVVASALDYKRCRASSIWSFIAAVITLDIFFATHLKFPSPCF